MAAPRGHLRRHDGPLLRERGRDGEPGVHGQRRRLERLADRRLRADGRRLLRRHHRRGADLQPRHHAGRGPVGHDDRGRPARRVAPLRPDELRRRDRDRHLDRDVVDRLERRPGRRLLQRLPRQHQGRLADLHELHVHRADLRHAVHLRRRGRRRREQRLRPDDRDRLDPRVRRAHPAGWPRRRLRLRRGDGDDDGRQVGERQHGHGRRPDVDGRPLRRGTLVRRRQRPRRPAGARHVLRHAVHALRVGEEVGHEDGLRRRRLLGGRQPERRPDALGAQLGQPLPPDAEQDAVDLPRLRARRRRPASGSTSPPPSTARRLASTSTAWRPPTGPTPATSATRTPGASAPTARGRSGSSTARSTRCGSTAAPSPPPRSRRT